MNNILKNKYEETIKNYKKETIDTDGMDRELAILIYKNRIYENSNHQFAFKNAIEDEGLRLEYDIETEIEKIIDITYSLSKNNEIYTFSVFGDGENQYLISHFENHLKDSWDVISEYIKNNNFIFGFTDFTDDKDVCTIFNLKSKV